MTEFKIPLAGVIGHPIAHSRSPQLHKYWLEKYGLAGHYIPMDVSSQDLPHVLNNLPKMGFVGVNVTLPHKETVLEIADVISDRASLIGAANTLTFQADGKLYADNTDGHGFLANLKQQAPDWSASDGPALVLGAGGAARAVIAALLQDGASQIIVANRTRARAETLKSHFGAKVSVVDWTQAVNQTSELATLVNTTALGMDGKEKLRFSVSKLPQTALVADIVYTPLVTELLSEAADHGCRTVDGLGMLLHQATPGFERWFGYAPEVDDAMRDAILS
ncbi:MAG: shikimate dehydrogenase [Litoreibacter sp.]